MMPTPYHVRLAISQYGEQFRAELFTEDLGDTEGDLLHELPPSIAEWVPYLSQGADLPPDAARQLGKDLFAALLGQPENAKKWSEVLTQADRKGQPIRLLIDATTEAVRDLPYGLLCEPHDDWFLFRGGKKHSVAFVRILRRCSPRPLKLRQRLRVLLAVAEPQSPDVPPFDAAIRLKNLAAALEREVELIICGADGPRPVGEIAPDAKAAEPAAFAPYTRTTREALRKSLASEYDVFHLLAHGHGAGVLLCKPDGSPAEATASELGEWCGAGQTALAFLQVCKAGQTAGRGGFGGVAQQLLNPRGGNLAAVVASTFPLDAEHSTTAAAAFYRHLASGKAPEEALTAERPETDWCWAFLELWARPGALGGTQQRAAFQFVSPYRGLSSFAEQDADLFFGRKAEVTELLNILRAEPVIAVVGDSGSGKTSLLQAGLLSAVRREGLAGLDKWRIASLRPGYRPAQALLSALAGKPTEPTPEALGAALRTDSQPLLVVFDQFEEVFTLARDKAEVQLLTTALAEAAEQHSGRFRLVLGMRSEFLGSAASIPGLSRLIRRPWVLRPPGADDMRDIVAGPAEHCGYTFQGPQSDGNPAHSVGLLDRILADPLLARDKDGASMAPLPLLQFALERLWLKAVEKGLTEFTHAEFDEIGGMGKAIAQHAEAVYQAAPAATGLGSPALHLAEQIITALVSARGTRQPRARDILQAETGDPDAARAVVDYLVGERLLTIRSNPEDITKSLVDLSHEALIHHWDRLGGWLAEDPQGRAMREEFRKAAEQWESGFAGVQPKSWYALPGSDVANNYLAWIDARQPRLAPVQQEFVAAMRDMLARLRRRRRLVMGTLAALTLVSSGLAVYADIQAGRAQKNAIAAKESEEAAKESAEEAKESEAKAKREERQARVNFASSVLDQGIQACEQKHTRLGVVFLAYALKICPTDAGDLRRVILTNLAGWGTHLLCLEDVHTLPAPVLATDVNGKYALLELPAGGSERNKHLQLYDVDTHKPAGPEVGAGRYPILSAVVLSNGIALLSADEHSFVVDMTTGRHLGKPFAHPHGYTTLSPDAKTVAVGAENGELRFWDVETGSVRPGVFKHQGKIYSLTFSADGKLLVTGCGLHSSPIAKLDPMANPNEPKNLGVVHLYNFNPAAKTCELRWRRPVRQAVTAVQISPDSKYVTAGNLEIRTWRVQEGSRDGELLDVRQSQENTAQIAFNPAAPPDFLTCSPSGSVHLRHLKDAEQHADERLSPQGWVAGAGFRADSRIFTANGSGVVRIWRRSQNSHESSRARHFAPPKAEAILSVAFRSDGKAIALGSKNGIVYFYDLEKGGPPKEFHCAYRQAAERFQIADVRFSTDGSRIIARDDHLTPFVFEVGGGPDPISARHRTFGVADDGRTAIVRTGRDLYQVSEVGAPGEPTGPKFAVPGGLMVYHDEGDEGYYLRVSCVAFTPDRSVVALLDQQGVLHMFRTATGESVRNPERGPIRHVFDGVPDPIRSIAFCPSGETFVTRSEKGCGLWKARTGEEVRTFSIAIGVQVTRFSPTGRLLLAGTHFNRVQVWDRTGEELLKGSILLHDAQVWGVAANRAETRIITASADKSARIWDLAACRVSSPPLHHREGVADSAFSPDGTLALTGGWDGAARLWDVPEPLPDDVERIILWVETTTGLKVSSFGGDLLTPKEWLDRKEELARRGGPPIRIGR